MPVDSQAATEDDLDYRYLLGDVRLNAAGVVFDGSWGWVPVIGFATALGAALADLTEVGAATIPFTESDDVFAFRRSGQTVEISATFTPSRATVSFGEFVHASLKFAAAVFDDAAMRHPGSPSARGCRWWSSAAG